MNLRQLAEFSPKLHVITSAGASFITTMIVTLAVSKTQTRVPWYLIIALGILVWLVNVSIQYLFNRYVFRSIIETKTGPVPPRRGLIVLVSPGELEKGAALAAIQHHYRGENDSRPHPTLEYLWLICSPQYEEEPKIGASSYKNAACLRKRYKSKPHIKDVFQEPISDPDSPLAVFKKIEYCYSEAIRLGLREEDVMADLTAGTKVMSVGMAYAAIPRGREVQFMKPRKYRDDGRADDSAGSDARAIDVDFVEKIPWLQKQK